MTRASKAAAVDVEIRVGDKLYLISPLRERDWSELEAWMQETTLDKELALIEKLPKDLEDLRKEKTSEAYDRSRRIIVGSVEGGKIMLSANGSIRIAWLALRQQNDLTIDDVARLCNDPDFVKTLKRKVDELNSADPEDVKKAKKKASRKKARPKPRTKRNPKRH